jgi:hypothetical protein
VLLIDHSTKSKDNPLFPSGSKRKRAAITGASYYLTAVTPLTREAGGRLKLVCAKDRLGNYKRGEEVASIRFKIDGESRTEVEVFSPPSPKADDDKLLTGALHATRAVKTFCAPVSLNTLIEAIPEKGSAVKKRAWVEYAVNELKTIKAEPGPNKSRLHSWVRDPLAFPDFEGVSLSESE